MQAPLTILFVGKSNKFLDLVCSFQLDVNSYDNNLHFQCAITSMQLNFGSFS